ncbi:MAG: hypothetical protein SGARI_005663, partial [Bacillariaceae sp.]
FESPTSKADTGNVSTTVQETDKEPASAVSKVSPSSKDSDDRKSDEAVQNEAGGPSFNKGSTDDEEQCLDQVQDTTDGASCSRDIADEKKSVEEVQDKIDEASLSKDNTVDKTSVEKVHIETDGASCRKDADGDQKNGEKVQNKTDEASCTKGTVDGKQSREEIQDVPAGASRGGLDAVDNKKSHGDGQHDTEAGPRESPTYTAGTVSPPKSSSTVNKASDVPMGIDDIEEAKAEDGNHHNFLNDPSDVMDLSADEYGDIII